MMPLWVWLGGIIGAYLLGIGFGRWFGREAVSALWFQGRAAREPGGSLLGAPAESTWKGRWLRLGFRARDAEVELLLTRASLVRAEDHLKALAGAAQVAAARLHHDAPSPSEALLLAERTYLERNGWVRRLPTSPGEPESWLLAGEPVPCSHRVAMMDQQRRELLLRKKGS